MRRMSKRYRGVKWIEVNSTVHNGNTTHEVKCPVCGLKVTYHGELAPKRCYICNLELKGANND